MANHPSALKRARQNKRRRLRNRNITSSIKTQVKKVLAAVDTKNAEEAAKQLRAAASLLHKGASRGAVHRNKASRKISRLSRKVQKLVAPAAP